MKLLGTKSAAPVVDFNPTFEPSSRSECRATFWIQATPGTSYWRCVVPARALPGQAIQFDNKALALDKDGETVLFPRQRGETAIWQFLGDSYRTKAAFGMRDVMGTRLLMEVDDNYTRVPPYMKKLGRQTWADTFAEANGGYSHEGHRIIAREVDGIICSTEHLADLYSGYNDKVWVCPNSIDPEDWRYERSDASPLASAGKPPFRIAYYGSHSHAVDAPIVTKALKWAARQPGVEITTVGFHNPGWTWAKSLPWQGDLAAAREQLFHFDPGIAPLKPNAWANGKSDVKVLEYAMAGVLPLMSRVEPHRSWFDVAPDLVLADDDWGAAMKWAVKNPAEVKARAAEVKEHVLETRTIDKSIHLWKEALNA